MLALELADFVQNGYEAENGMCVAVYRAPNSRPSAVPAAVFQALEEDAAGSVTLIPYSAKQCPFDKILETVEERWLLFASEAGGSSSEEPDWLARISHIMWRLASGEWLDIAEGEDRRVCGLPSDFRACCAGRCDVGRF